VIARVALAAGFGLDLERCDPAVFAALVEELEARAREERHRARMERLRSMP
jgi:hypothetical protein